jgi:hypothetical protein
MAPAWPATLVASLAAFRQPCPAPPFTYGRGAGWALAMLGSPRQGMCNSARRGPAGRAPDVDDSVAAAVGRAPVPVGCLVGGRRDHLASPGAGQRCGKRPRSLLAVQKRE